MVVVWPSVRAHATRHADTACHGVYTAPCHTALLKHMCRHPLFHSCISPALATLHTQALNMLRALYSSPSWLPCTVLPP